MYKKIKEKFPKVGEAVKTKNGTGKVIRHNAIHNRVAIRLEDGQEIETGVDMIINESGKK
jgi:cell fate regulator YaaT (PSP1 superfamily)